MSLLPLSLPLSPACLADQPVILFFHTANAEQWVVMSELIFTPGKRGELGEIALGQADKTPLRCGRDSTVSALQATLSFRGWEQCPIEWAVVGGGMSAELFHLPASSSIEPVKEE